MLIFRNLNFTGGILERTSHRIKWVDTLKFLGIFAIYIGHFADAAGRAYPFVFLYHVPLFFLVSGFFATSTEKPFWIYFKGKCLQLVLPYYFFSFVALIYFSILNNWQLPEVIGAGKTFIFGIRNQVYAASLWFLPCLFVVVILHYSLLKISKNIFFPFIISILLCIITQHILPFNPLNEPSWIYNIDSALYYYFFYTSGAILFPLINRDYSLLPMFWKWINVLLGIFCAGIAIAYFLIDGNFIFNKVRFIFEIPAFGFLYPILIAFIIIYANIILAKAIAEIPLFGSLGRETLVFCGIENVFKSFLMQTVLLFGLTINLANPFLTILFSFICLLISYLTIIRILNQYFPKFVGKFSIN
ncbi:acyltransferase family protein [Leptospira stimsonii]|uniref:acyltransferase family protein n=1 Tax=Leptospira stimsonii TaxID=2202203 RepID=UPI003CCFE152